jgi:hypothetical protein
VSTETDEARAVCGFPLQGEHSLGNLADTLSVDQSERPKINGVLTNQPNAGVLFGSSKCFNSASVKSGMIS